MGPPVGKSASIAIPMNDAGTMPNTTTTSDGDTSGTDAEPVKADGEQRHGHELWHSFNTIVFLTQSMRAQGILGDIQSEMWQRNLPDASWTLLQERVLCPSKETVAARSDVLANQKPR